MQVPCPYDEHETHEPYSGVRNCAWFRRKVDVIAQKHDVEIRKVLSTDLIHEPVSDEELGVYEYR